MTDNALATGKIRVFVYGTLKKGHPNHYFLENKARFLGYDKITGPYTMINVGAFPALVRSGVSTLAPMYGEVWAGDEKMLKDLDFLEGNGKFYTRSKVWTDVLQVKTWVYFLPEEPWLREPEVDSGIWLPEKEEVKFWEEYQSG